MWSQLKKNLGDNVIQKIGDVVAPPPEDSQSDSSYGSYEEEEEEDIVSEDSSQDEDDNIGNKTGARVGNSVREVGKLFGGVLKRAINEVNNTSRIVMSDQENESYESDDLEDEQWDENDIALDTNCNVDSVPIESLTQHLNEWNDFIRTPTEEKTLSEQKNILASNDKSRTLGAGEQSVQSTISDFDSDKAEQARIAAEMEAAQRLQRQKQQEEEEKEAKLAEQARIAAEMEAAQRLQQQKQQEEEEKEAKLAEQARIAAEMEAAQRLQQQKQQEEEEKEAKLAEQARIAAEMEAAQRLQQQKQQEEEEEKEAKLAEQVSTACGTEDLLMDQKYRELEERIKELESNLKIKDERIIMLNNEIEKISTDFKEESSKTLNEYERSLDKELKEMSNLYEEQRNKMEHDYINKLNEVQKIVQKATSELSNKDATIAKLQQQVFDYKNEIQEVHLEKISAVEQELDIKVAEIQKLKLTIKQLEDDVKAKTAEHAEVDEEADELHQENEELQNDNRNLMLANERLEKRIKDLEASSDRSVAMHIEMQLMKEERDREANKLREIEEAQSSSIQSLISERDTAISQIRDLEQRLTTLQADFDVTQADMSRVLQANSNLQSALEAFQTESEAELAILEESRASSEQALIASHDLAMELVKKENQRSIDEIQIASDKAIHKMMDEVAMMEEKHAMLRKENIELRRSLDEAIKQLQMGKEDVIDRTLMKNILLDWFSKTGKGKRDVLMVMSSVLHFSDEDKSVCGLNEASRGLGKVINSMNPIPLSNRPPSDVEGENVREKFVNFLLAECGDSPSSAENSMKADPSTA